MVKSRGGKSLVPIVGGAVGGALMSIICLVLVALLIIIRCRIKHSSQEVMIKSNHVDTNLSKLNSCLNC